MSEKHGKKERTIFIAGDNGKFYKITDSELEHLEVEPSVELEELRDRGVAYAGIDRGESEQDGPITNANYPVNTRYLHFVNLAHTTKKKGSEKE